MEAQWRHQWRHNGEEETQWRGGDTMASQAELISNDLPVHYLVRLIKWPRPSTLPDPGKM